MQVLDWKVNTKKMHDKSVSLGFIVGCRGASQLGGSLLGIHQGYKANKL